MSLRNLHVSPDVFYGELLLVPTLSRLLSAAPHIQRVEVIGKYQFYDIVYRVRLMLNGQTVVEEIVREFDDSFLFFVERLASVRTRKELLELDQRDIIFYD